MSWLKVCTRQITLSRGKPCIWVWTGSLLGIMSMMLSLSGCISAYENFKEIMESEIGQIIDNAPYYGFRSRPVDIKTLPNGNFEYRYTLKNFRGTCKYILEVEKSTRKVIAWRYDGEDKDKACFVNP